MTTTTSWEENMKVRVQRIHWEIRLKDRTRTDEKKMVQLYYLVPGCVIAMFLFVVTNRSTLVWSV